MATATTKRRIAAAASCRNGRSTGTTRALCWECGRCLHDRFSEPRDVYEHGLERARAAGDVTSVQGTLVRLAEIACWTGPDSVEADRLADECMALADRTSSSVQLGGSLYVRGLVDAQLGRLDEARGGRRGDRCHVRNDHAGSASRSLAARLRRAVARRPCDGRTGSTRTAQALVDRQGQREPARYRFQPDHIEAVVELGDVTRARAMLGTARAPHGCVPASVDPRHELPLPRARGGGRRRPDGCRHGSRGSEQFTTSSSRCRSSAPGRCSCREGSGAV